MGFLYGGALNGPKRRLPSRAGAEAEGATGAAGAADGQLVQQLLADVAMLREALATEVGLG
jgi:hypothetical protein